MRLNQFLALHTSLSRRKADEEIQAGNVLINEHVAHLGAQVQPDDTVTFNSQTISANTELTTILLNKPVGYVCSKDGQGNKTVYDLLPSSMHSLNPVGRLDKNSSGVLLLTNDGNLAQKLTHPSFTKNKVYIIKLDKKLTNLHKERIEEGIKLKDGISALNLKGDGQDWKITMHEGRNRQIRRTFEALGYTVKALHRIKFGNFDSDGLGVGSFKLITKS